MSPRGRTHLIRIYAKPVFFWIVTAASSSSAGLKCNALMSAHFPADGLTGTTLNALCPRPNLWVGEKNKAHMKPISQSVIRNRVLSNRKNTNKTEIDFICFPHLLSQSEWHSLSLAIWRTSVRFNRRIRYGAEWKGLRRSRRARIQNKSFSDQPVERSNCRGRSRWSVWRDTEPLLHADMRNYEL